MWRANLFPIRQPCRSLWQITGSPVGYEIRDTIGHVSKLTVVCSFDFASLALVGANVGRTLREKSPKIVHALLTVLRYLIWAFLSFSSER